MELAGSVHGTLKEEQHGSGEEGLQGFLGIQTENSAQLWFWVVLIDLVELAVRDCWGKEDHSKKYPPSLCYSGVPELGLGN